MYYHQKREIVCVIMENKPLARAITEKNTV